MKRWIIKQVSRFMATCRETTEGYTDLTEGALSDTERTRMRRHLMVCPACKTYRAQMETGVKVLHELPKEEVTEAERDAALNAFRQRQKAQ